MKREIYEVNAKVVDAAGGYSNLTGYPISFDSHQNNDDIDKTNAKAYASYYAACQAGETARATGRPLTIVSLMQVSTGLQIEGKRIGIMPDLPDPTYQVTVTNGSGSGAYVENANVAITANEAPEGKVFSTWDGASQLSFVIGDADSEQATFVMPPNAVNLTATYVDAPVPNE